MRDFALLYAALDETNKTNEKVAAMVRYFESAPPADAAWAVHFLMGRRPKRLVKGPSLWGWAREEAGLPDWLFAESYDAVGDLAEAMALVLPEDPYSPSDDANEDLQLHKPLAGRTLTPAPSAVSLRHWVENRLLPLGDMDDAAQQSAIVEAWQELDMLGRFVFNKLITGAFRVGVSQDLVVRALSKSSNVPAPTISHRLMGPWHPTAEFFQALVSPEDGETHISKPYPFCLAHPLEQEPANLGDIGEWHAEWKWDGIRAQLIRRQGQSFIWSRGEDLITERFPEIQSVCDALPDGTVIDGEILAWEGERPMKFLELQKRIGRKVLSKRILEQVPVVVVAFDLVEHGGQDLRERPFEERRRLLKEVIGPLCPIRPIRAAERVEAGSWEELKQRRESARELNVEGLMLKRLDSPYLVGRKKGLWWKWKIDPMTVDCVLIYAQRGNGKRASLYTDYTFGVWNEGKLVPFAKAYSGLTDEEIRQADSWIRRHTTEKFGPVRAVEQELVFELAFESIQLSTRHKSGVAVRFPRIARWRHDKKPDQADSLDTIKEMLKAL
jgi:DNA ligase-1